MLRQMGYEVELARTALDGVRALLERCFDVVLCDMNLGDGTAGDMLASMEALDMHEPVLLMSAWVDEPTTALAEQHSCVFAVVAKPVDSSLLHRMVEHALESPRVVC